jgi:hypothetical protein
LRLASSAPVPGLLAQVKSQVVRVALRESSPLLSALGQGWLPGVQEPVQPSLVRAPAREWPRFPSARQAWAALPVPQVLISPAVEAGQHTIPNRGF